MHDRTIWDGITFIIKAATKQVICDKCAEAEGGWELLAAHDGVMALEAQVVKQGPIE